MYIQMYCHPRGVGKTNCCNIGGDDLEMMDQLDYSFVYLFFTLIIIPIVISSIIGSMVVYFKVAIGIQSERNYYPQCAQTVSPQPEL